MVQDLLFPEESLYSNGAFTGKALSNALESVRKTLSSGMKITCRQMFPKTDLVPSDIRIFTN